MILCPGSPFGEPGFDAIAYINKKILKIFKKSIAKT